MAANIFCFGTSGGCLDSLFLAKELYQRHSFEFLSDLHQENDYIHNIRVAGGFNFILENNCRGYEFIYQCGSAKNHAQRNEWFNKATSAGLIPKSIISNKAYIHQTAEIGEGSIIYPGAVVMTNVKIGTNCIILPNSVINHDSVIGSFSIINSNCSISGGVQLGELCYIGAGSSIKENLSIASSTTIGLGSVLTKSVEVAGIYYGLPAKLISGH